MGESMVNDYLIRSDLTQNQENQAFADFKKYLADYQVSTKDHEQLSSWVHQAKYVNLYIYQDDRLMYTSSVFLQGDQDRSIPSFLTQEPAAVVKFADGEAKVFIEGFFEYKFESMVLITSVIVSGLFCIFVMLFFVSRKTSYIGRLEQEIKILEGGDLKHPLTVMGKDELSSLAQSINEMRLSFIERLESEEQEKQENLELITALSHDLRTLLTVLVGYLDLIKHKKYKSDDDLLRYLNNSSEKAHQIKTLSDQLFNYFTVSS
ncbi:HAMP domain-containing protein [Paenibacillus xylanexedens]|uniref:HAMP domain-containing protein n=1 Tax=Paenibacillus xylanexedens TaxID=528191 RepID=UPI001C92F352|nr:HAMP domain-containing protein [Paenibacillus xylanexedens]